MIFDKLERFDFTKEVLVREFIDNYHRFEGEAHTGDIESYEVIHYFDELASRSLSDKQYKILAATMDGYTQEEIAEMLGVVQSTVSRNIDAAILTISEQARKEEV